MSQLWRIYCDEESYPGLWQRWFKHQCVTVGWYSKWGFTSKGAAKNRGWARARNALQQISTGDCVIVSLSDNRVGRIGVVTGKAVSDSDWNPLVPISLQHTQGEQGRRIEVRWDLTVGPDDRDMVVSLPSNARFSAGELRPTLCKVSSLSLPALRTVMRDSSNWTGLLSHFGYERSLSDYIATYPHHLEDGLQRHPDEKLRERVFADRTRADVLLIDPEDRPVVVECKQGFPSIANIQQIRHYMTLLRKETGRTPRGIIVHGGSRSLRDQLRNEARKQPQIKLLCYRLRVDFDPCS